jgi:hypothetical protein
LIFTLHIAGFLLTLKDSFEKRANAGPTAQKAAFTFKPQKSSRRRNRLTRFALSKTKNGVSNALSY